MNHWHYVLAAALLLLLLLILRSRFLRRRNRKHREFSRKLETVLQPKENVKAVCPNGKYHWIATDKRLLMENGEGFRAIPYGKLKFSGEDAFGKKTTSAAKMAALTVKADRDYLLRGKGPEFTALAKELVSRTRKPKKK